jgi:glycosyltransferase involved in cell wall biosynthesis
MLASPLRDRYRLVHFESGSRGSESPAKDERLWAKVYRIVTSPFFLAVEIVRSQPVVVHLNGGLYQNAFWRDFVYMLVSKLLGRRVVIQIHGGSVRELCAPTWMRWIVRSAFGIADGVVLLAKSVKAEFEELGITKGLTIIPNAVNVLEYRGNTERVHSGRVQRLVYMGRLIREKGVFEAMEAVEILRKDPGFSNLELRIAGSGPASDEIAVYIQNRGLSVCVKLMGPLFGDEKVRFLREADVFVFPTYHKEGLPYCILESLAAGTPVITTAIAGIPDVVVDGVHGRFIRSKNASDIVRVVQELGRSEDTLRAMSKECVEWATSRLGLERLAMQFGDLYESLHG